ncbi:hypothetical protein SAMN04488156_101121 [Bacillus sp. 166amftsu]|nr:hypothetical protein SAMN04488156_101121 [Bacillus sp. 166amftsu]
MSSESQLSLMKVLLYEANTFVKRTKYVIQKYIDFYIGRMGKYAKLRIS